MVGAPLSQQISLTCLARPWTTSFALVLVLAFPAAAAGTVYYVSSATGNDTDDGLTPASAFASIGHINNLGLAPGDEVRFLCDERWRAEPLVITASGTAEAPIVFSSQPADCAGKPVLSGSQPISGWAQFSANIFYADLDTGLNAGLFPLGLNQLFRGAQRLPMGRWPNISGHPDGGYAEVDSQPSPTQIVDGELPAGDWSGAVMHIKGIRWYMLNREVTSSNGPTLHLAEAVQCWSGDCSQWGYFLNSHLATLDQEGEWYFDADRGLGPDHHQRHALGRVDPGGESRRAHLLGDYREPPHRTMVRRRNHHSDQSRSG
jgi:hypothetical protein